MQKITKETLNKSPTKSSSYFDEPKEYVVGFIPRKNGTYRIEIDCAIEEVSQFSTAIQVLDMAKEDDDVEIYLQCPGGNVDASGAFLHAMHKCLAPIHIVATGGCHSASTHILLAADSFELAENFNALIHNGSAGAYGNINEYHSKSDFDKSFIRRQYDSIYEGFLTPEDFSSMMDGKNIWVDAEGWYNRSLARMEYFKSKQEAYETESQADIVAKMESEIEESSRLKKPKSKKAVATA
jgi:ATP-dependent protease ClpP protease subunit